MGSDGFNGFVSGCYARMAWPGQVKNVVRVGHWEWPENGKGVIAMSSKTVADTVGPQLAWVQLSQNSISVRHHLIKKIS